MKARDLNSSSQKTKKLIKNTFAELLHEKKNIHKISVTELVNKADINRSTFYSHYDDIYQVAEDIKAETMKAFFSGKNLLGLQDIEPFFDDIGAYIKENDYFFKLIFSSAEVTNFVRRLGKICKDKIYNALKNDYAIKDKHLLELEISTFSDGLAMQFIRYYHGDLETSLEDIIMCGKIWCKNMIERRTK